MIPITATDSWHAAHPGALFGFLEMSNVERNNASSPTLDLRKRETESLLRERYKDFTRQDFLSIPAMAAYHKYYKRFSKTYHVLLQIESIVLKGKSLPNVSPLVDSNFTAEVETLALTAGHDVSKLSPPIFMDVAREGDQFTQMGGAVKSALAGDMVMRDAQGLCCSIIHGQDDRSPITPATTHVLYVVYAPVNVPVEAVQAQLQKMEENVRLFSPNAVTEQSRLLFARV